jgi:hypothetical protein
MPRNHGKLPSRPVYSTVPSYSKIPIDYFDRIAPGARFLEPICRCYYRDLEVFHIRTQVGGGVPKLAGTEICWHHRKPGIRLIFHQNFGFAIETS